MCGIFGLYSLNGTLDSTAFGVPSETGILEHRGPDAWGYSLDDQVYFGHRRLSIIDLKTGSQPVFNEDRTCCVIFNGEIFNFQEIRKNLETQGHRFRTHSDTEVIIHAYEEFGTGCVDYFRGMFAFAVWDSREKSLFLARDRLGIKPLFYGFHQNTLIFGSEMKAILQYKSFPRTINPEGLASFFSLGYIPTPWTIYEGIHRLQPGHVMLIRNGHPVIRCYWDLCFQPDHDKSEQQWIDSMLGLFDEAVRLRMISDVPIGAFLSGGLDSGAVVASMSRHGTVPARTFCIGFGGNSSGHLDERPYARNVARVFRTIHSEHEVQPNLTDILDELTFSFDEPFADPGAIPSYYVCQVARQHVTVALSGLGGDELFGGYERHLGFKYSMLYNLLPKCLKSDLAHKIIEVIPERADGHYTVNHIKRFIRAAHLPDDSRYLSFISVLGRGKHYNLFSEPERFREGFMHCTDKVLSYFNAPNAIHPLDRAFYCDIKTWLPDDILACTDRMSMWHSLEVRVPFLDHKLMEFCATIPHQFKIRLLTKKYLLKKAMTGILPDSVMNHRKQGFIGPMSSWLQTDLKPFIMDFLNVKNLKKHGLFNTDTVSKILNDHFNRIEMNDKLIWSLVMFQNWYHWYIERNYPVHK